MARILPPESWPKASDAVEGKYWLARLSFPNKKNTYLEIEVAE